jgi:ParB-like chromosome segregation protein Spo0J
MESRERSLAENYQFANLVVSTALEAQAQEELRDALRDELGDAD